MPQLTDVECDAMIQEIDDERFDLGGAADRAVVRGAYRIAISGLGGVPKAAVSA